MIMFEQGTVSTTPKTTMLLYIIVFFAILLFSIRAAIGYRSYKRSVYPYIYDNYLFDYFYKTNVFRDTSRSCWAITDLSMPISPIRKASYVHRS